MISATMASETERAAAHAPGAAGHGWHGRGGTARLSRAGLTHGLHKAATATDAEWVRVL